MEALALFVGLLFLIAVVLSPIILISQLFALIRRLEHVHRSQLGLLQAWQDLLTKLSAFPEPRAEASASVHPADLSPKIEQPSAVAVNDENIVRPPLESVTGMVDAPLQEPSQPAEPPPSPLLRDQRFRQSWSEIVEWLLWGERAPHDRLSREFVFASQWLLRLGSLIFILGVGLFLKHSFENNWIPPEGRILFGFLGGVGMIIAGTWSLGGRYHLLGQGLVGSGAAILFLTLYAAHHIYSFVGVAGATMSALVISLASSYWAWRFNSQLLALIGVLGGYATPLLLHTSTPAPISLMTYILVLSCGVTFLALMRRWPVVEIISLLGSWGLMSWGTRRYLAATPTFHAPEWIAMIAGHGVLLFEFSWIPWGRRRIHRIPAELIDALLLITNAFLFYASLRELSWRDLSGLLLPGYTLMISLIMSSIFAASMLRREASDPILSLSSAALGLLFALLTITLVCNPEHQLWGWILLSLILSWLGTTLASPVLRMMGLLLALGSWTRAFLDDLPLDYLTPISSGSFWPECPLRVFKYLGALSAGSWFLSSPHRVTLQKHHPAPEVRTADLDFFSQQPSLMLLLGLGLLTFTTLDHGVGRPQLVGPGIAWLSSGLLLSTILSWLQRRQPQGSFSYASVGTSWFMRSLVFIGLALAISVMLLILGETSPPFGFFARESPWLIYFFAQTNLLLVPIWIVWILWPLTWSSESAPYRLRAWRLALSCGGLALSFQVLSCETEKWLLRYAPDFYWGGLSIAWTVYALVLVCWGLQTSSALLRYTGLSLLAMVTCKVFFIDLSRLPPFARIIALVILGILFVLGSILYQRRRGRPRLMRNAVSPSDNQVPAE
ncbi:MAG: hypothetical protein KatS3mg113_0595 [Planctomycetaceae bacterium]|nr:MAG: hypothetical protein KatS3mg113_0595 [Planctomycetaceae bacterium]